MLSRHSARRRQNASKKKSTGYIAARYRCPEIAAAADGVHRPPRRELTLAVSPKSSSLDDVDFGRQVARHFQTNFLLTNCGLRPNLHFISSIRQSCLPISQTPPRAHPPGQTHYFCAGPVCGSELQSQAFTALSFYKPRRCRALQIKCCHDCVCLSTRTYDLDQVGL